jgi:hypothetical protein
VTIPRHKCHNFENIPTGVGEEIHSFVTLAGGLSDILEKVVTREPEKWRLSIGAVQIKQMKFS